MSTEAPVRAARIVDFDDTIMDRGTCVRFVGMVWGKIHPQHLPKLTLDDIAKLDINHGRVEGSLGGPFERFSFWLHSKRKLYPGVRDSFSYHGDGSFVEEIIGSTGRSNKAPWPDMTEEQLVSVRDLMKEVNYTPHGVKTAVSKAHVVYLALKSGQYDEIDVDEDDPRTAVFLGMMFLGDPRVHINYIPYKTTSKLAPKGQIEELSNIRVESGMYQYEREETEDLETQLTRVRQQILRLESFDHWLVDFSKRRLEPEERHSLKGLHSFVFDKFLERFNILQAINRINYPALPLDLQLPGSLVVFHDGFEQGAMSGVYLALYGRYTLPFLGESARFTNGFVRIISTNLRERLKPYLDSTDDPQRQYILYEFQQAGFRLGRLLADPTTPINEVAFILGEQTGRISKIRENIEDKVVLEKTDSGD